MGPDEIVRPRRRSYYKPEIHGVELVPINQSDAFIRQTPCGKMLGTLKKRKVLFSYEDKDVTCSLCKRRSKRRRK